MDVNPSSLIFCVLEVANKQIFILANMHYRASYNVINVGIFSEELRGKPGGAFYNKWRCASRIEKGPKEKVQKTEFLNMKKKVWAVLIVRS